MQRRKKSSPIDLLHKEEESISPSWFEFISPDKAAIPVGPPFQAQIPNYTGPPSSDHTSHSYADQLKWLGTKDWPINTGQNQPETEEEEEEEVGVMIGKGRDDNCTCTVPGSIECVKCHILEKRKQLLSDLGPAFGNWSFDTMGDGILKSWNMMEQNKFVNLVKMNPASFVKQSHEILPSKKREEIIGYYFNVYVPRRLSKQTRLGCKNIDSDDDEFTVPNSNSEKLANRLKSNKDAKTKYLTGRR
ncbi:AT-rich interactive domain-containing protein 1-like [Impatiens glandulifera]|uniref:AT-rich interactive domain-containing protein 1-like n=1 Tax=Impatiens glandulifera TaxID=253017 RepID=UPI001FB15484|nr:AT-rich interactive domain-containing protein 1-like [Impatiens glandulifera]